MDHLRLGLGQLLDLLADESPELLVGGEEGLLHADRMLDDADHHRVPVAPVAAIEEAVAPDHQLIGIARREGGGDEHLLAGHRPAAFAIGQVDLRQGGHRRMFGDVADLDAEIQAAAVEIERAGLERRLAALGVELAEADEIIEQRQEIAPQQGQAQHVVDGAGLVLERLVLGDQPVQLVLVGMRGQLDQAGFAQRVDREIGLAGPPGAVRREGVEQLAPAGFVELGGLSPVDPIDISKKYRRDHLVAETVHLGAPGRIDMAVERQGALRRDLGQGHAA